MQKITSKEELDKWLDGRSKYSLHNVNNYFSLHINNENINWWVSREICRIKYKEYRITSVLDDLNKILPYFVHVSSDDPTLIAYTPDATFGQQDRQLKSTLGKFLSKYFYFLNENKIRELIEKHNFEINPTVTWYQGDALTDAYINRFGDLGACMSKAFMDGKLHPTMAYHTPYIKLACFEINGKITARSLVYEKGNDKRFFRVYGNQSLTQWLNEKGYVLSTWEGISLKKIEFKTGCYLIPYLDEKNGRGNYQKAVVLENDIYLLNQSKRYIEKIADTAVNCVTAQGFIAASEVDKKHYLHECFLSKKIINELTENVQFVYYWDSASKSVKKVLEEKALQYTKVGVTTLNKTVYSKEATEHIYDDCYCAIDPNDTKVYLQLEPTIYGKNKYSSEVVTVNGINYLEEHCVKVYTSIDNFFMVYKKDKQLKNYVKTSQNIYLTKNIKTITTTLGKVIVPGIHKCWQLIDGSYVTAKPKYNARIYRYTAYSNSLIEREDMLNWGILKVKEAVLNCDYDAIKNYISNNYAHYTVDGLSYYRIFDNFNLNYQEGLKKLIRYLQTDDPIYIFIDRYLAEANAIEAPNYLTK